MNQNTAGPRIGIALLGKGATNHLHRPEVVEAFHRRGAEVIFVVRDDYDALLERIPGCTYVPCRFAVERGARAYWRGMFRYLRRMYPASNPGVREFHRRLARAHGVKHRLLHELLSMIARLRAAMRVVVAIEALLYRSKTMEGLDPKTFDELLILGIGIAGTQLEGTLTWWARRHGIPVVHIVGNYDNLSSQGFRGVPVERILVWGESMCRDAVVLQGIDRARVIMTGPIRYDAIAREIREDRETFLSRCGLDPNKRTILFAGSLSEFHYFEALAIYKELQAEVDECQLIVRVYPNKTLMNSVYMEPLLDYAAHIPGVYVSLADPHYQKGVREREVLQIEESELWHALRYADVVVNLHSTIALEACIFDKPAVNMWYFGSPGRLAAAPPVWKAFPQLIHNRRMAAYRAISVASNRHELVAEIRKALANPDRLRVGRARAVASECGRLDGHASDRLAEACLVVFAEDGTGSLAEDRVGGQEPDRCATLAPLGQGASPQDSTKMADAGRRVHEVRTLR